MMSATVKIPPAIMSVSFILFYSYNGGTKPPQFSAGFAISAKGVTCVTVGFSDLFYDLIISLPS